MAAAFDRALDRFLRESPSVIGVHYLVTKWRLELPSGYLLDLYFNESVSKYSYTLVREGVRIIGWDNAPHHPELAGFPHHVHQADGRIEPSDLTGDPEHDLDRLRHVIDSLLDNSATIEP